MAGCKMQDFNMKSPMEYFREHKMAIREATLYFYATKT